MCGVESVGYYFTKVNCEHNVCKMSVRKSPDLVRSEKKILWNTSVWCLRIIETKIDMMLNCC